MIGLVPLRISVMDQREAGESRDELVAGELYVDPDVRPGRVTKINSVLKESAEAVRGIASG